MFSLQCPKCQEEKAFNGDFCYQCSYVKEEVEDTTPKILKYCLFEGRHPIPGNPLPLYEDFDFEEYFPITSKNFFKMFEELEDEYTSVEVYVTGLTPALTDLIFSMVRSKVLDRLTLLHYNRETNTYFRQDPIRGFSE